MSSTLGLSVAVLLSAASAPRELAVLPVREPGVADPSALMAAAHALRAILCERTAGVLTPAELRGRVGAVPVDLAELERAYAGAQAAYQADEAESAVRILSDLVAKLQEAPESAATHALWVRAQLRLAQAERARGGAGEAARAMERVLALEPAYVVDADQFAPAFRRDFEAARARVQLAPRRALTIRSRGEPVLALVDGKELGQTPVTVELAPGAHRVRGALSTGGGEAPLTPAVAWVAGEEPAAVELDAPLAAALHLEPAPSLVAAASERGATIVSLGAWLRVDQVVAVSSSGDAEPGITATLYDVRERTLVREASAPLVGGTLRAESANALAAFLLTGERSTTRVDLTSAVAPRPAPARWLRPTALAAGVAAVALGAVAVLEARAAHDSSATAAAMVRPDGVLAAGTDRARYDEAVRGADVAMRNAYVAGAGAVVLAVTAAILGYRSLDARDGPFVPAVRF